MYGTWLKLFVVSTTAANNKSRKLTSLVTVGIRSPGKQLVGNKSSGEIREEGMRPLKIVRGGTVIPQEGARPLDNTKSDCDDRRAGNGGPPPPKFIFLSCFFFLKNHHTTELYMCL